MGHQDLRAILILVGSNLWRPARWEGESPISNCTWDWAPSYHICSISGIPRFFKLRREGVRKGFCGFWVAWCWWRAYWIIPHPKEIPNFHTLDRFFKQLIDFSAIIPPYITYPKEILKFYTPNRFFKQLIDLPWVISQCITYPTEIPIFHTLFCFGA